MADNIIRTAIQRVFNWAFNNTDRDKYEAEIAERQKSLKELAAYYDGVHKRPLKVTTLGKDYNVITNQAKVIISRTVAMLLGGGVEFDLPGEGDTPESLFIDGVWKANNKEKLLLDLVQFGSIYGTPAMKIIPNGIEGTFRLVALNPYNLSIIAAPDDIENVLAYVYRWQDGDTARREVTLKNEAGTWNISMQHAGRDSGGQWVKDGEIVNWAWPFPPIAHGKNLPRAGSVYGESDIQGIIELQDRYNEAQSNQNKILALQAWAQKFVTGGQFPRLPGHPDIIDVGPDKVIEIANPEAKLGILQPNGDLASSRQFANDIRRDLFEIADTVDSETVKDHVGTLTNFGLRVLFKNEIAKNATKQLLYALLLKEVNRRLLTLQGLNPDPGEVKFGYALPGNDKEEIEVLDKEHSLGITSLQTIARERHRDWETEQERLKEEKQTEKTIGGDLIRQFMNGKNLPNG